MRMKLVCGAILWFMVWGLCCQNYDEAGEAFSRALAENRTCNDRISALQAFIKKYPDTGNLFVKLAYFNLATHYFQCNDFENAVKYGNIRLKMGAFGEGEESRLFLVLANAHAITTSAVYNREKGLQFANEALRSARSDGDTDAIKAAQTLIGKLSGPAPLKMTPEQEIKTRYAAGDYAGVIQFFRGLKEDDRKNPAAHLVYAHSLLKANQPDNALTEFKSIYAREPRGSHATKIADIYHLKAKNQSAFYDDGIRFYLEASVLFQNEKLTANSDTARKKATSLLGEQLGYNQMVKAINEEIKRRKTETSEIEDQKRKLTREIERLERRIEKEEEETGMVPDYLTKQKKELQTKLQRMNSGIDSDLSKRITDAENKRKMIDQQITQRLQEIRSRLK